MPFTTFWTVGDGGQFVSPPPPGGGGGKGGGGKGAGWTGGKGWQNKSRKNVFTDSPAYYLWAYRGTPAGAANADITAYNSVAGTDTGDFNTTTGVFTAPYSTYYLVSFQGSDNVSRSVVYGTHLKKNGSVVEASNVGCYPSGGTTEHMISNVVTLPIWLDAGDTLNLYQSGSGTHEYVFLQIATMYTDYLTYAKKATGTGTRGAAATVTGWDSVALEYTENYSGAFNTTTGVFTCPTAGNWVLMASGYDTGVSVGAQPASFLNVYNTVGTLTAQTWAYNLLTSGWGYSNSTIMLVVPMLPGYTAVMKQESALMSNCRFMAFRLPPDANAWCIRDYDGSTTDNAGAYTGWAATVVDTNGSVNLTNGTFTLERSGPHFFWLSAHPNPTSADGTAAEQNAVIYASTGPNELARSRVYNALATTTYPNFRTHTAARIAAIAADENIYAHQEDVSLWIATLGAFELRGNNS